MNVDSTKARWRVPDRYHLILNGISGGPRLGIPNTSEECLKETFIFDVESPRSYAKAVLSYAELSKLCCSNRLSCHKSQALSRAYLPLHRAGSAIHPRLAKSILSIKNA